MYFTKNKFAKKIILLLPILDYNLKNNFKKYLYMSSQAFYKILENIEKHSIILKIIEILISNQISIFCSIFLFKYYKNTIY